MRFPFFILFICVLSQTARAELHARLAYSQPSPAHSWELLALHSDSPSTIPLTLILQDARGGPSFTRTFPPFTADIVVPLPFIAPASLPPGYWPVNVTLQNATQIIEKSRIEIPLATPAPQFRVLAAGRPAPALSIADGPVHIAALTSNDLANAPPLLFATADAILFSADQARNLTQDRAAQLLAEGARLIITGNSPPPSTGTLVWDRLSNNSGWICATLPSPRRAVIEPGLTYLPDLRVSPEIPPSISTITFLLGPAALVVLLLARGLFRKSAALSLGATAGMLLLTVIALALIRHAAVPVSRNISWQVTQADFKSTSIALTLNHSLITLSTPLGGQIHCPGIALPIAPSAHAYFSMNAVCVSLDDPAIDALLPAGTVLIGASRTIAAIGLIPPCPTTSTELAQFESLTRRSLNNYYWIDGGYVFQGTHAGTLRASANGREGEESGNSGEGIVFPQWSKSHPALESALRTWYELAFDARHRYLCASPDTTLRLIDFTPVP